MSTQTMQAIQVHAYGGPEQLKLEEIARPIPQAGEVLVHVHAAGVNPLDWKIRQGTMRAFMPVTFPYTPGIELAGVIADVGSDVTAFKVGQAVFGQCERGAYAEYAVVSTGMLALKPAALGFTDAASMPVGATAAWRALFEHGDLTAGQRVLIQGAVGGVGIIAVQLAKWKGAEVIASASTENVDFMRQVGADMVVDYTEASIEDIVRDVDLVLDGVGTATLSSSLTVVRSGGTLISLAGPPPLETAEARGIRAMMIRSQPSGALLQEVAQLVDEGRLKAFAGKTFRLAAAQQSHEYGERGRGRGRIVLVVE